MGGCWLGALWATSAGTPAVVGAMVGCLALGSVLGVLSVRRRHGAAARTTVGHAASARRDGAATVPATAAFAVCCLALLFGSVLLGSQLRTHAPLHRLLTVDAGALVTLEVTTTPRPLAGAGPPRVMFSAQLVEATAAGERFAGRLAVRVLAGPAWRHVGQGQRAQTRGVFVPEAGAGGEAGVFRPRTAPLHPVPAAPSLVLTLRQAWVLRSAQVWAERSPDAAALLPGMVMGDRSGVSGDLAEAMQTVGLTHLTAVSGTNCTLVFSMVLLALRSCRLPRAPTALLAVAAVAGFVVIVGPDPSVLRAAVMGALGALALLGGRPRHTPTLLSASIVVLLLADPWLAGDAAFQLSVVATAALTLFGRACVRWLSAGLPWWLAQAVAVPLVAALACGPVLVLLSPRLSLFTIPANVVAAPVVALVTAVGTLGLLLAPWCPAMAQLSAAAAGVGAGWVAIVARTLAVWPAATVPWPEGPRGVILLVLLQLGLILAPVALSRRVALAAGLLRWRRALPPRLRRLCGFPGLTLLAAATAALLTALLHD